MANTYQDALIDQLDPTLRKPTGGTMYGEVAGPPIMNTGVAGERAGAGLPNLKPTGGDAMGIASSYDTTNMSGDQRRRFQQDTQAAMQRDAAGNQADLDYLAKNGGNWGSRQQYRPGAMPNAGDYGGISEGGSLVPPMSPEASAPAATPTAGPKRYDLSGMEGYDETKFNDPNKMSAKYQIGRALNPFDARQGITPDVVAALNKLGLGTFSSGGGDKLSLSGLTDAGRKAGLVGDYRDADFIKALKSGNGKWIYADPAEEARQAAAGGGMAAHGGNFISPILAGQDAGGNIQSALGRLGQPSDLIQQLIAKLQGAA